MLLYPDSLDLCVILLGNSIPELCELIFPLLLHVGLPQIKEWEIPLNSGMRSQGLKQKLEQLCTITNDINIPIQSKFALEDQIVLYIDKRTDTINVWNCDLFFFIKKHHTYEELQAFLNSAIELCRQLLHQTHIYSAKIKRQGGCGRFCPTVPIVGKTNHLILTTKPEVEQSYDNPDVFTECGVE